jgi:signal transduction histidine kinase
MSRRPARITLGYICILIAAFAAGLLVAWTPLAERIDRDAYDWMFRIQPPEPWPSSSVVLAIDETTLTQTGGMRNVRRTVADAIERILPAKPAVVAIDLILPDTSVPADDAALEAVFERIPKLILASDLIPNQGRWEDPLPRFARWADAIGHVHAAPDPVSRAIPLEKAAGQDRRWALAFEAFRHAGHSSPVLESPADLEVNGTRIPAERETARAMYIRYREGIPELPIAKIRNDPASIEVVRNKAVFIGVTAQTAARDRLLTPLRDEMMSGVQIHAQAFETLASGRFLHPASNTAVILMCLFFTAAAGLTFAFLSGWAAYGVAASLLCMAHVVPHVAFSSNIILPYLAPVWSAWLSVAAAGSWQYFVVRRQLRQSESEKMRYQHAIQLVTHEMRSPLTAIQGSSELMGRYNLSEEKRRQIAQMINSESKRLARMIQTFLDVERLTDGSMKLRSETFASGDLIDTCVERARPLAERKNIQVLVETVAAASLKGDRELMEYAIYNLLTNAIKYSPAETVVTVSARRDSHTLHLSVRDQGIGMDEKELRNIFQKFYRTKKAEASGEAGTGIGLSIVEQIVNHHGGRIEVVSSPGKGSCFTMVLPCGIAPPPVPAPSLVSQ